MPRTATNTKAMAAEIKSLAMVAGGFVIGSMGGSALDRMMKVDPSIPGINAKRFVKPFVQLGAGVLGATKLKSKDLKLVASGVGASGVVSAVQIATKKNLLAGAPALAGSSLDVYEPMLALPEFSGSMDSPILEPEVISDPSFEIL